MVPDSVIVCTVYRSMKKNTVKDYEKEILFFCMVVEKNNFEFLDNNQYYSYLTDHYSQHVIFACIFS